MEAMVVKGSRFGRENGKGFLANGPKSLWPGLQAIVGKRLDPDKVSVKDLKDRYLFVVALEAARCMFEGIVTDPREADVGSILGFKGLHRARWRPRGEVRAALRTGRQAP